MGLWKDGWCASVIDTAPYLQVFFGYLTNVSVIETEGVTDDSTNSWVESYYVSMSNDSQPGSFVNYTEQGVTRIFQANDDIQGKNLSLEGTRAHYIRIHPVSFTGSSACVRIALYGCDSEDFPSSGILLQRVNNETPEESVGFDRIIAVIPAVFGALLLGGSLLFLIRYLRKRSSRQMKGYSTMEEEEGIYQTIPSDLPMYEVQTVAIEMGPDKALNSIGIWNEAYESYVGDEEEEEGIERHYQSLDDEEYEHIYENLPSAFEVQTLSVEVNGKEVVPGEVHSENAFYESVYPESKLEEKRRKQGFFELPRYRELSEEEDDDYDDNEDNGSDNEGYEDIYDNIFFPEEPSEDQKKRTLTFSPQQTAEDGIFSYENKIFSFDRRTTTLEEIQRKKSQVFPFL
nr:uncharacterized protein LOC131794494 [Pocillopora verrucosa]